MRRALLASLLVLVATAPLTAQERAPSRWLEVGGWGLTLASFALMDGAGRSWFRANPGENHPWAAWGRRVGKGQYGLVALGATFAAAELLGDDPVATDAAHALLAFAGAGAVNGALKVAVGRARPGLDLGPRRFQPFEGTNAYQSFPSGHATVAFSLATILDHHVDNRTIPALAYGGATVVAWSRLYHDKHWASDVLAGALIGHYVTARILDGLDRDPGTVAVGPVLDGVGLTVRLTAP